jgi:hypothetical protein
MEFFFKTGTSYLKIAVFWDNAAESSKRLPTFWRNILPVFSGQRSKPSIERAVRIWEEERPG